MTRIGEQTLMRYADGELGALRSGEVERAIAEDSELRARLARDRRLRDRLSTLYDAVESEPVPPHLAALTKATEAPSRTSARVKWGAAVLLGLLIIAWIAAALL